MDLSGALEGSDTGESNNESTPNPGVVSGLDFEIAEESPRGGTSVNSANGSFARSSGSIVNPDFTDVLLSVDAAENVGADNLAKV